jgi:hypothetical protein
MQVFLNFVRMNQDTCAVSGTLPSMPTGFNPLGQTATIDVGGAHFTVNLDAAGSGLSTQGRISLTKGSTGYLFSATFNAGGWHSNWADENLTNASVSNVPRALVVTLTIGKQVYTVSRAFKYTANFYWGKGQ